MCHDSDSRPPQPPDTGGSASGEDIELTAEDGNRFSAYVARPGYSRRAEIVIFPDGMGLRQFYKDLALRFAEQGIGALAMDYYGRSAGTGPRDETFNPMSHMQQLKSTTFFADVRAALAYLHQHSNEEQAIFTVGFCAGGALSLLTGTSDVGVSGVIGFYGVVNGPLYTEGTGRVAEQARRTRVPVLGLFGGTDQYVPVSAVEQFEQGLASAAVNHEIVIYPDVPHSFFDRRAEEFAEVADDAWRRVLAFIAAHSVQGKEQGS